MEKNLCVSGLTQFKPMLVRNQLYLHTHTYREVVSLGGFQFHF